MSLEEIESERAENPPESLSLGLPWERLALEDGVSPLGSLAKNLLSSTDRRQLLVVDARLDRTGREVGAALGLTRQRVQQLEAKAARVVVPILNEWAGPLKGSWQDRLAFAAVSEAELFAPLLCAASPVVPQHRLGLLALRLLFPNAAAPVLSDGTPVQGWWTFSPKDLGRRLHSIAKACPFSTSDFEQYLQHSGISAGLSAVLEAHRSAIQYHANASAWVRSRATHRDAAVHLLRQAGRPMGSIALTEPLGMNAKAVVGNLTRDDRFRQLRPSGEWTLTEWLTDEQARVDLETTLDALISVLRDHGPLHRRSLIGKVLEIYPVSAWSVINALESELVGLTDNGFIDLVEHGAIAPAPRIPRRPNFVTDQNGILTLRKRVDSELLRGSGLAVGPYLGWAVGLQRPGETRTFYASGRPPLVVRRGFGNSTMSAIRQQVIELKASLGDTAIVELALSNDAYRIYIER